MKDEIIAQILNIVIAVAVPMVLFVLNQIKAKINLWLESKIKNETIARLVIQLNEAAFGAVSNVQPVVDEIKAAAKDGKLTKEEIEAIKQKALDEVKANLGSGVLKELETIYGDAVPNIQHAIEGALQKYFKKK